MIKKLKSIGIKEVDVVDQYTLFVMPIVFWNMLLEGKFEHDDFLKIRLMESRYSFEDFMNKSLAYCVMLEKRIVAVMIGTACFNRVIAIDIETCGMR